MKKIPTLTKTQGLKIKIVDSRFQCYLFEEYKFPAFPEYELEFYMFSLD